MLYLFKGKIYVKPFVNRIVEVNIKKSVKGEFDVIATKNVIIADKFDGLTSISIEEAYKISHKKNKED